MDDPDFDPETVECEHKVEHCISALCGTICHGKPSEHGCEFNYCCDYDHYLCDGECETHKKTGERKKKEYMLSRLYETKRGIEACIDQLKEEMA